MPVARRGSGKHRTMSTLLSGSLPHDVGRVLLGAPRDSCYLAPGGLKAGGGQGWLSRASGRQVRWTAAGMKEVDGTEKGVPVIWAGCSFNPCCWKSSDHVFSLETVLGFGHLVMAPAGDAQHRGTLVPQGI